jgi:SAM-dependent methyltransferase
VEVTEIEKLTQLEDKHWWYAERRTLLRRMIRGVAPGDALDIGAAGGGNTRVMTRAGWRPVALEYSAAGAGVAQSRGLTVVRADAQALPFAQDSFDLVVAFDVLEHVVRDDVMASEIHRVLRPGAVGLIAVPADMRLWSAHDEAVGHVRRYDREGLHRVLSLSGLQVESLWSWNVLLRPVAAFRRRRSTGSDLEELPRVVNIGLRAVVAAEKYLPVKSLPGVSLVAQVRAS